MSQFEHDVVLRAVKAIDAVMITVPFLLCWYLYYADKVVSPYYEKGNYLMVALYFALYIIIGRVYDSFLMSSQLISEIVYNQAISAAVCDRGVESCE